MTPPFSAVSKSCDPPSVSTPLPLLISDKASPLYLLLKVACVASGMVIWRE